MIDRRAGRRLLFYMIALLMAGAALSRNTPAGAQQVERQRDDLRITAVDTGDFPTVAVRVMTTTGGGAPIADLTRLVLRENGLPIVETTMTRIPVGIDLALVLDANSSFLQIDGRDGVSRRDKVVADIGRFAEQFMGPAGLDQVSIIAPDDAGESAAFLITDAGRSDELIGAISAWDPAPPRVTPLQAMLSEAIDHLAGGQEGRFRAILIYTDGARLSQQLDYQTLVEAAQADHILIYAAILGAEASEDEIANVARLYSPTNGAHVHMPEPGAADPLYDIFRQQGLQAELSYESDLRQSGVQEVSVNLGNVRDTAKFELSLAAPEVAIVAEQTNIRRAGSAVDTPLPLLQPSILPLTVQIVWSDGRPRPLSEVTFRVDGVPQPPATGVSADDSGQLPVVWDISERDAGRYILEVEVTDELGFRAKTEPLAIMIEIARPLPPEPTPVPTRIPSLSMRERIQGMPFLLPALAIAVIIIGIAFWSNRRLQARTAARVESPVPLATPAIAPPTDDRHVAVLVWSDDEVGTDRIELVAIDVTLGRDPDHVDIVMDDPTVSRLHARIRRNAAGEYWLYDEGSIEGTLLNYQRLGLAPRRLQHNDVLQMGRITLRFRLELPGASEEEATQPPVDSERE